MQNNDWNPAQAQPNMEDDTDDWRIQLQPDARQRIVSKITDNLKRHSPVSGPEGLFELDKIAVRFEEKIYTAATSLSDYLRKISLKMLTMETKSVASGVSNSIPSNYTGSNENPSRFVRLEMGNNNFEQAHAELEMETMDDWRSTNARQNIVCKIKDTMKGHLPVSSPEGLVEIDRIAVKFEEKIYTAATSQTTP